MGNLNCSVRSCQNNYDNMCSLSKIKVEGPGACTSDQTCCASFTDRSNMSNSAVAAVAQTNISCRSGNCVNNKKGRCRAENISMGNMCATPSVMGETECDTFSAR